MKWLIERQTFASLAFFPIVAGVAIEYLGPVLALQLFPPTGGYADMGMELILAGGIGILLLCFSLVPSIILTIIGFIHTITLLKKGENSASFIILTIIAAIPLLYILQGYIF